MVLGQKFLRSLHIHESKLKGSGFGNQRALKHQIKRVYSALLESSIGIPFYTSQPGLVIISDYVIRLSQFRKDWI
jgi:hypothetical protein